MVCALTNACAVSEDPGGVLNVLFVPGFPYSARHEQLQPNVSEWESKHLLNESIQNLLVLNAGPGEI